MATPATTATYRRHVVGADVAHAACEASRLGIATVIEGVATGIVEIGAATPVVAPLCVALLKAKSIVDGVSRYKDELEELQARCDMLTAKVIDKCKASEIPAIDVDPLVRCVQKLKEVAQRYHDQGTFARLAQFRRDGDDIRRLRDRVDAVVPILGLEGVVNVAVDVADIKDQVEIVRENVALLHPSRKLAAVPKGLPVSHWNTVRDGVVERVCQLLGGDGEPKLAALTGRSGAGKTTAAASMVGERGPLRPRAGETEEEARKRLDRVRALFPDGVVGLRVGKGEGAADRLPRLMQKLAIAFHEDVMGKRVAAPAVDEAGESYVKSVVLRESLRCLVVADDVWEEEVVEKLRHTGMWVLVTTRNASMVQPHERVVVDTLTQSEAEDVLRGAARLPPSERLCDAAMEVVEMCGHVAMDIAFVGSWSSVRAVNGVHKSSRAWADAVKRIKLERITNQIDDASAEEMDDLDATRIAVLHAGYKYIGAEDPLAQELYVMLAVFPDGYSFGESDIGVLLDDEEVTRSTITMLERWSILRADASGLYSLHDAHVDFAREKLMGWEDVRRIAVCRWSSYISHLDFATNIDVYTLLNVWHALERVGGEGLWVSRPYDDQLVRFDAAERSKMYAVNVIAELYEHDQKFVELEALMRRVLEQDELERLLLRVPERDVGCGGSGPGLKMTALFHISQSIGIQGRFREQAQVTLQLREIAGRTMQLQMANCDDDPTYASTIFNAYGFCEAAAGFQNAAEIWFRKALKAQEDGGLGATSQAVFTLHELGKCVGGMGRWDEAKDFLEQALRVLEARLGPDSVQVSLALHVLGVCARRAGKPAEAELLYERSLDIKETRLGLNNTQTILTLKDLSRCVRELGRLEEADTLFLRAMCGDLKQGRTRIPKDMQRGLKGVLTFLACCAMDSCVEGFGVGACCVRLAVLYLSLRAAHWVVKTRGIGHLSPTEVPDDWYDNLISSRGSRLIDGSIRYLREDEEVIFVNGLSVPSGIPTPFAAVVLARVLISRIPYTRVRVVDVLAVIPRPLMGIVEIVLTVSFWVALIVAVALIAFS